MVLLLNTNTKLLAALALVVTKQDKLFPNFNNISKLVPDDMVAYITVDGTLSDSTPHHSCAETGLHNESSLSQSRLYSHD